MKVMLVLEVDVEGFDLYDQDDQDDLEDKLVEGLTSEDVSKALAECLATWYLSVPDNDVLVEPVDARIVQPVKDGRKRPAFHLSRYGGLVQDN